MYHLPSNQPYQALYSVQDLLCWIFDICEKRQAVSDSKGGNYFF